jgi:hypothetical protein
MPINFQSLFSLQFRHSYFADGQARNLTLVPSAETALLLKGRELLLRGNTVVARTNTQVEPNRPHHPLGRTDRLVFFLSMRDARFFNYTDYAVVTNRIYRFTNAGRKGSPDNLHLSQEAEVSSADLVDLRPSSFRFKLPAGTGKVSVRDVWGQTVQGDRLVTPQSEEYVGIQLQDEPSGTYSLWAEGGTAPLLTFFKDDAAVSSTPAGVIELLCDIQSEGDSPYGFVQFGKDEQNGHLPAEAPTFSLQFKARSTRWRYLVVEKYTRQPHRYQIATTPSGVEFVALQPELLPDGSTALPLESATPLLLQERPSLKLNLQAEDPQANTGPVSRIAMLPFPGIDLLKGSETTGFTSEIFVYV